MTQGEIVYGRSAWPGQIAALVVGLLATAMASDALAAEEYKSEGDLYSMQSHFAWCEKPKTAAARVKRYEQFWELQAPEQSDGYDDDLHVRTVRRCAYRLATLYSELGRTKECLKMLKWLEKEDAAFDIEKTEEQPAPAPR